MKTCQDTDVITGCGKEKPETEFQRTKHGTMAVCRDCLQSYRHGSVTIKRKHVTSEETQLYNQLERLWR